MHALNPTRQGCGCTQRAHSHSYASTSTPSPHPTSHARRRSHSRTSMASRPAAAPPSAAPAPPPPMHGEEEREIPSRRMPTPPAFGAQPSTMSAAAAAALDSSLQVHMVQWYPGHIAKAERQLKEQLKMVDVVLEVRDARIIRSTSHPQVPEWVGSKPRLLVINRSDAVSAADRRAWTAHFAAEGVRAYWTDGKLGAGTALLRAKLLEATAELNAKRAKRGLQPRPVRSCVIGFPNIGKSALINRLLNRKVVDSAPKPGVTRLLKWVRLGGQLDMLDAPGVIPASFNDQIAAQRLAMCNDIGEAAYVESLVASALVVRCKNLPDSAQVMEKMLERYKLDPREGSAEDFVHALAHKMFFGDTEKAGARLLKDFRSGALGSFALEVPGDAARREAATPPGASRGAGSAGDARRSSPSFSSWEGGSAGRLHDDDEAEER